MNNFNRPYGSPNNGVPCRRYNIYGGSAQPNQYNNRYTNNEYAQNQYSNNQYMNNEYNQNQYNNQYINNGYNQNQYNNQYANNGYNQNQYNSQYVNNGYSQNQYNNQYANNGYNQNQYSNNQHNYNQYFGSQYANNQYCGAAAVGAVPQPMQFNQPYTNTPANTETEYKKQMVVKQRKSLRKTSNRVGGGMLLFVVFTSVIAAVLMSLTVTSGSSSLNLSTVMLYIINAIASLVGEFIVAAIIMAMCKTNINQAVKIKSVSIGDTVKYTLAAMGFVYVFNLLLSFMNINLSMFGFQNKTSDYGSTSGTVENIIYFIAIAVVPPIIEEFLFRGAILCSLRKHGDALAIVVSAVMFGFAHSNFIQTPVTFLTGLVLAYLTVKTNSLIPAIIIHFVNNGSAVAFDLLSQLNLDSMVYSIIDFSLALVFVLSGLICTAMLIKKFGNKLFEFDSTPEDNPNGLTIAKRLRYVFTSPWMIIYTVVVLLLCIQSAALA
ncbi:lysostaphin resistance A-like protein [Oscillospiraceae bacterium LCP25S3_E10]|nr:CPBP family intramembrane metalloprotease [Ruminococcus sp.]MDY2855560.1 type II CAAX endopeptidase family protein [Oscillospiraceae bacterium]